MFRNITLRSKLALTIVAIGVLVGGVNIYQIFAVRHIDALASEALSHDVHRLEVLQSVRTDNSRFLSIDVANTSAATGNVIDPEVVKTTLNKQASKLYGDVKEYQKHTKEDPESALDSSLVTQLVSQTGDIVRQANSVSNANMMELLKQLENSAGKTTLIINTLLQQEETIINQQRAAIQRDAQHVQATLIMMTVGVTTVSVLIGIILMTSIARSLTKLRRGAERIANGDLSAPIQITTQDEIGQLGRALNAMSERLRDSYRRLAIEQERDEAILQGMGEGLIATDEHGAVVLANRVSLDYLNIEDGSTAVGKSIQELYKLYDETDKEKHELPMDQRPLFEALSTGTTVDGVYAFYKSDGKRTLLNITATPIKFDNTIVGAISIMRDVTKEREIDRMKTEFISLASHQLRTPLSAIKWFTEMLVSGDAGKLTDEQLEFAKNIDDSTERMIALVNALLNISRIESGRIMIDPKPTDLHELVAGIVNDLKAKTEERQQTLIISVHQELPKINLDPRLIGQVYLNLLTNAIKYTPKGGEVSVFISRKDDEIISQITDNGYGIPKEQQGRIFQKFFRASNAVKVETDGTGLGLYLIKAVVESSGGKIWFESEEGKGTTFWFSMPVTGMQAREGEVTLDV